MSGVPNLSSLQYSKCPNSPNGGIPELEDMALSTEQGQLAACSLTLYPQLCCGGSLLTLRESFAF